MLIRIGTHWSKSNYPYYLYNYFYTKSVSISFTLLNLTLNNFMSHFQGYLLFVTIVGSMKIFAQYD